MPTYEYRCNSCGHVFEAVQSIADAPLSKCPKCGKKVRRVIHGGMGVIFKGSGFYTTDYKKSSSFTGGNGKAKAAEKEKTPDAKKPENVAKKDPA